MTRETFDEIASIYDDSLPAHVTAHYLDKRVRYLTERCDPGQGLDVGCGTGVLAGRLAELGFEMTGIDPSKAMLDVLERRAPEVRSVLGSGIELPFKSDGFDLVLTVAALHHIAEPRAVRSTLAEMVRVCRPGGRIVVWDHNPRNPYWKLLMARVPQDDGSERLIGEREVIDGIAAAGGRVLCSERLGFVPDFVPAGWMRPARAVERAVERSPGRLLCAHNVILASKD